MNKRYMDFVPAAKKKAVKVRKEEKPAPVEDFNVEEYISVEDAKVAARRKAQAEPKYGVVEDLRPTFVNTNVEKSPLGKTTSDDARKKELAEIKSQKIVKRPLARKSPAKVAKKSVAKEAAPVVKPAEEKKETLAIPKNRFVKTKVEKRPLSKNVYKKEIVAPKEELTGPITIISKPDGSSHVGLIVTVVITIILGAAAGTVAFLLLPK